ncbi:MAG: alkaline phosphatase [Thermoguttaceae bacterium]|nr:alkaline phosphatase [Thermoguttaceae bacterium]
MKRLVAIALFCCVTLAAVGQAYAQHDDSAASNPIKHVLLIGWDGYGSAYVNWDEVPNLKMMKENGAWTLKTRCVLPSVSAINWASILMGAGSELHGYRTWGSSKPDLPSRVLTDKGKFPDIFSVVHQQRPDALTASAFTWKTIGDLHENPDEAHTTYIHSDEHAHSPEHYQKLVDTTIGYLKENSVLTFVYFSEPDVAGHENGWGSEVYHQKVAEMDGYVGQIIKYLQDNDCLKDTLVIFVSDHGGTGKGHGHETMQDMETPFIIYGAGVKKGEIESVVVNYDTAATIAWALQLTAPDCWRGKPVKSAFEFKE